MPMHRPSADLLPTVDIPLLQPPIPDDIEAADGGIGLRHIEHPLLVHMARPENTPPGTVFELYWGDPRWPVAGNFIREDDEDLTRIPFIVPVDHILEAWADPVYAKVIRSSGNSDETERLRLRVNLQRPGGRDPDDETPGHQRLVYELPPDVLIDGVDDTRAAQGVEIVFRHWENMAPYDLLILVWGSERIEHRVQPDEVNTDIRLTVDYANIGAAGNGEAIPVGFQVEGATGNYPDEWARWSPITWVDVYLDTERPEAPWLTFPETERDIELEQLGGQAVRVGARVSSADARAYSVVTLVWAGTDNEGVAVPHLESQNLSGGKAYYFNIEHALVAALAKGTAYAYYLLQGDGLPDKRSYNRHLRILGDVVKWPAPTIDQLIGDYLEPDLPEATVRFPAQASWPDGAFLDVMVVAEGVGSPIVRRIGAPVGNIPITPEGEMLVMVPDSILKHFNGYPTEVYYVLSRQGALPQESLRLKVHVGEPVRELPEPIVEKAYDGVLNPDDITEYAWVIAPFTGTLQGDWITLYWIGPGASTSVRVQVGVDGATTEHSILIDYITANLDEQVKVFYTLERSQQRPRYSHIATVEIRQGLGELPPPGLSRATITGPGTATLAPLDVQTGTTLVVSYVGMRDGDSIQVTMQGTAGAGSPVIAAKNGLTSGVVTFGIPASAIGANIGNVNKTFMLKYEVTRANVTRPSITLTVTVTPIPVGSLPRPLINSIATGGLLDITGFGASTLWSIAAYPFQFSNGQIKWLTYKGTDSNNQAVVYEPWSGANNGHAGAYSYNPNHNWFRTLKDGTTLTIEVRIAFDKVNNKSQAVLLQTTTYTVKSIQILDYTNFDNQNMNGWTRAAMGLYLTLLTNGGGIKYFLWHNNGPIKGEGRALTKNINVTAGKRYIFEATLIGNYYGGPPGAYIMAGVHRSATYTFQNEGKDLKIEFTASATGPLQFSVNTISNGGDLQSISVFLLRVTQL
ncbi:hypothetical protein RCO22_08865 [Pseudomonas yamanorum]|uniref:Uncharacterized protein n=1 Tax=Pseudomonas yamanorum TaxID=515393 RepID=A0ABU1CP61_9PSED|nr:hypothetical protein [Pseudomonas yamanorum]MDR0189045.1 hypothetical protein [Pseudomonas yamanorum]